MKTKKLELGTLLALLAVAVVFPFLSGRYMLSVGISILLMALLGQSWNIMSGYAGQFSFGHAAFFGIGAYTSSILYLDHSISPWFGMIVGMCLAALLFKRSMMTQLFSERHGSTSTNNLFGDFSENLLTSPSQLCIIIITNSLVAFADILH